MLKLNRNIEIAIAAIEELKKAEKPVRVSDLAAQIGTTEAFLEQIVRKLRIAGITDSTRGPGGGVSLVAANGLTVLKVAKALGHYVPHGNAMGNTSDRVRSRIFGVLAELTV